MVSLDFEILQFLFGPTQSCVHAGYDGDLAVELALVRRSLEQKEVAVPLRRELQIAFRKGRGVVCICGFEFLCHGHFFVYKKQKTLGLSGICRYQ